MRDREVRRWAMYSFANHGWVTTVVTALVTPWLLSLAVSDAGSDRTPLFSIGPLSLSAGAYPTFVITVASLLQVVLLPLFGAAADSRGHKRSLLLATCVLGSAVSILLALPSSWLLAGLLFVAGTIIFGATDVVYNSYLPSLAPPSRRDAVSGFGVAIGYLGAALLLALNLLLLTFHSAVGIDQALAVRLCFVSAGLWWLGFGLWSIAGLSTSSVAVSNPPSLLGLRELRATLRTLARTPQTARYLIAFLLIADGVSAVSGLASVYITHELFGSDTEEAAPFLLALMLMTQFLAVASSVLWPFVARRVGTKLTIVVTLVLWSGCVVYAYLALHSLIEALVLGFVIGMVIGGTQALCRSLYSQLIPAGRESTYFSLYAIADKGTSWVAPLLFTVVVQWTGSFRQAILSLIVMFVAGIALLATTNVDRAREEATGVTAGFRVG